MRSLLNHFRIGTKITGVVIIVLILTLGVGITGLVYLHQTNIRLSELVDVTAEQVRLGGELNTDIVEVVRAEKNTITATSEAERLHFETTADDLITKMNANLTALRELADPAETALIDQFSQHWEIYLDLHRQVRTLAGEGQTANAIALSTGDARDAVNAAQEDMDAIVARNDADMAASKAASSTSYASARDLMIAITAVALGVGLTLGLVVTNSITTNLRSMVSAAEEISSGRFDRSLDVRSRDETGDLAAAFQQMIVYLKEVTGVAQEVSRGNLAVEIHPRSDQDALGHSIRQMMTDLRRVTAENRTRLWHSTGQAQLSNEMRGELPLPDLARKIITFLCQYLNAQLGAIFVVEDDVLTMVGSYAYTRRKGLSQQFRVGEGLVGQAALEKQIIQVNEVPEDYIRIQSGLGDSVPTHILVLPFLSEDRVIGVVEIASFAGWTDAQVAFLESVAESIGIGVSVTQARSQLVELLDETQRQSEELQIQTEELETQQEELRQTNEELEEQSQTLRESERNLQVQQEELRATNEELTEKTGMLERQRAAVEHQNADLEVARTELEQRAEDLALASKYKSEFLSNMSHELRTPLNSMLILARVLMDNETGNLTPEQIEAARVIQESGQDLLSLINDILDLAKVEAGRMSRHIGVVSISDVLATLDREFQPIAREKKLVFETELSSDVPATIRSDQRRLMQVMKNLISNAVKFTPAGSVRVVVHRPDPEVDLSQSGLNPEKTVAFSVIDTGIGIAPENHRVIFEAFQQADGSTSRQYGGTGLGLSISRELAGFLGGEIDLISALGEGSTFTLYLPETLSASEEVQRPAVESESIEVTSPRKPKPIAPPLLVSDDRDSLDGNGAGPEMTLLIVDDDPRFAKILVDFGRRKGFKCLAAGTGEEALQLAATYRPAAIILDLKLPGISGWDVLDGLKENPDLRHIPVHIISVEEETVESVRHGAIGHLTKPAQPEELEDAFHTIDNFLHRNLKTLLIVEDDKATRRALRALIGDGDVECLETGTAASALDILQTRQVDCMILDLRLPDMSGFELLDHLSAGEEGSHPPVIVYTGKELSREENDRLMHYVDTVIVKGIRSEERLLDETALFLHRVVADLPAGQQKMIRHLHDKELTLAGKRILLADDDVRNAFALSSLLSERGLEVEMVTNGQKALDLLDAKSDTIDLVLMDVMMPVMDGFEAIRRIRSQPRFQQLPILALTAKAMRGDREKCLAAGANDYLSKPIDADRLFAMLRVWLYR